VLSQHLPQCPHNVPLDQDAVITIHSCMQKGPIYGKGAEAPQGQD
jgi:hypothetical protein